MNWLEYELGLQLVWMAMLPFVIVAGIIGWLIEKVRGK
jgi:hypothetical protein